MEVSKWGYVSEDLVKRKWKHSAAKTSQMVTDMSQMILDQEKELDKLKTEIMAMHIKNSADRCAVERLIGYQERVRELDPPRKKELLHNYIHEPFADGFKER